LNSFGCVVISDKRVFRLALVHADIATVDNIVKAKAAGERKACSMEGSCEALRIEAADACGTVLKLRR